MSVGTLHPPTFWRSRRAVGFWLLAIAAIILGMITVGGLTRITGSGLSITEWDPIMGAIPPLSDAAWAEAFAKYQRIPQYVHQNAGMSLAAFKGIFWWEWIHRLLGRLLGVAFLVPFLWFAWTGAIARAEWPRMLLLFVLGGLQGFVGWWMVQSGLETRLSVSQYRLAIHLGFALILLVAIVWIALEYLRLRDKPRRGAAWPRLASGFAAMVYVQMLLGALVAGLHAGLIYNTWPLMDGRVFPESPFFASPWWINLFENPGLAQFDHRIGAYIIAVVAIFIGNAARRASGWARFSGTRVLNLTAIQLLLGIATLLLQAPEFLAAAHQLVAALAAVHSGLARFRIALSAQRLIQVRDDVLGVLDADREAHHVAAGAGRGCAPRRKAGGAWWTPDG
ncbi:MAG: COX15/CtaA family protein [Rhizomicrobium sp.]